MVPNLIITRNMSVDTYILHVGAGQVTLMHLDLNQMGILMYTAKSCFSRYKSLEIGVFDSICSSSLEIISHLFQIWHTLLIMKIVYPITLLRS